MSCSCYIICTYADAVLVQHLDPSSIRRRSVVAGCDAHRLTTGIYRSTLNRHVLHVYTRVSWSSPPADLYAYRAVAAPQQIGNAGVYIATLPLYLLCPVDRVSTALHTIIYTWYCRVLPTVVCMVNRGLDV